MPNILGLLGSPRPQSHTDLLLTAMLQGAKDKGHQIVKINVCQQTIAGCKSCYACAHTGTCILQDDMSLIYHQLAVADTIILASPLYFMSVSAQLKTVMDRCQVYWSRQHSLQLPALLPEKRRQGFFICTGGAPNKHGNNFIPAIKTAQIYFRALATTYIGDLTVANTDQIPVSQRTDLLEKATLIGRQLYEEEE